MGSLPTPPSPRSPSPLHPTRTTTEEEDLPKPWIRTPVIHSTPLSHAAGARILLKLENLQPSGSFKSRGIGNLMRESLLHLRRQRQLQRQLQSHPLSHTPTNLTNNNCGSNSDESKVHFYSSSGGNAGLACVAAARMLGCPATVVVPLSTSAMMVERIRAGGATEVLRVGESWKEADEALRLEVMGKGRKEEEIGDGEEAVGEVYVPPFDHEDVWAGNAGIIMELDEVEERPDVVICSVGGGGLFCGIMQGLERRGWEDAQVVAVETEGAASLARSLEEGRLATLDGITSIATSLGARRVAERAFRYAQQTNVKSVVLSDAEAAMGCWRLADEERLLVEPACGVSAALCWDGRLKRVLPDLKPESRVLIVVCGGSNITLEMLVEYRKKYGMESTSMI